MIIDILNLTATIALAIGAAIIAWKANVIAHRSVRVEVDKHIFEWGQRSLNCLSHISSLRLIQDGQIEEDDFRAQRRALRAELFALKEEGALFFEKSSSSSPEPALEAMGQVLACLDGRRFEPPRPNDYQETRRVQNNDIRSHTRNFVTAVQNKVGGEWSGA